MPKRSSNSDDTPAEDPVVAMFAEGVVTLDEAAALLKVEKRTVQQMVYDGQLPYTRVRSKRVIPKLAITRMLIEGLVPAAE